MLFPMEDWPKLFGVQNSVTLVLEIGLYVGVNPVFIFLKLSLAQHLIKEYMNIHVCFVIMCDIALFWTFM